MSMPPSSCPLCAPPRPDLLVADLGLVTVRLNEDQFFPGYCFVVLKQHAAEPYHLPVADRTEVMEKVYLVARALETLFTPDKMNLESLGNMVPHVHWHVVPRLRTDALWPSPIWSEPHEPVKLEAASLEQRVSSIRNEIARLAEAG